MRMFLDINLRRTQHHQHYTIYSTSPRTRSSTQNHQHYTISTASSNKTSSTQHHQHDTIQTTHHLHIPTLHHQHNTINTTLSTQRHQHNTINKTPSTQHQSHFAWHVQHAEHFQRGLRKSGDATIEYCGRRLRLPGRCSTWSTSVSICVAGAARGEPPERSAADHRD